MTHQYLPARVMLTMLTSCLLALATISPATADDTRTNIAGKTDEKTAEAEIWALEHAYFVFHRDARQAEIVDAWHDKFLGWPEGEPKPIDKTEGTRYVRENYAEPAAYTFEIERTGFSILGEVAVNHYTVHRKWEDGKTDAVRITHTWVREKASWKVLGGMSMSL